MVTGLFRHRSRPCSTTMQRTGMMMVVVVMVMMVGLMMESVGGATVEEAERPSRTKRSEEETAEWSVWFNSDSPAEGDGDFETIDSVSKTHQICSWYREVVQTQCRVAGTNDSFDSSTTAFLEDRLLQACSRLGLICLNSQQTSGRRCHDYEVRFLCKGSKVDSGGDSLFPNLDFKIYILLAAVPLLVIILRLLWSCWWKPRLKQRRLLRRQQQQHRGSLASGGTLSSSSSQASIDSSLANPPPAYTELFGDGQPAVFSISGRECAGCGKCLHRDGFVQEGMVEVSVEGDGRGTDVAAAAASLLLPPPPSQDVPPPELDEVFEADASQDSDGTGRSQTVSRPARSALRHSSPSSASVQGAEASAPPPPAPSELSPSSTPVQCTCACHQLPPSGYVNLAFRRDSSTQVDSPLPPPPPPPPLYPGMHKPVFPFARIGSVTSFTSLPDYEEALEILKKSGLFLDEEKV